MNDDNFYAIKVQNSDSYSEAKDELKIMKRLPKDVKYFNHLVDYFVFVKDDEKYLCTVFELHCGSLDDFIRKGDYKDGFPREVVDIIYKQILLGLDCLHNRLKVFHGDIKPDNILLRGRNNRDKNMIRLYQESNFKKI